MQKNKNVQNIERLTAEVWKSINGVQTETL